MDRVKKIVIVVHKTIGLFVRSEVIAYFTLGLSLFSWVSLPKEALDEVRKYSVASFAPAWKLSKQIGLYLADRPSRFWKEKDETDRARLEKAELENQMLRSELEKLRRWLISEQKIKQQMELWAKLERDQGKVDPASAQLIERRLYYLQTILQSELIAIPSEVIYRDPSSWSSSLWISVGEEDNQVLGRDIVAKNSPVVAGTVLVGLIDYVGKKQSRVRLVTDAGLVPSVRCVRGSSQGHEIKGLSDSLIRHLEHEEKFSSLTAALKGLSSSFAKEEDHYLAKGELHGSSRSLWRRPGSSLKGIGFNMHFPDDEKAPDKETPLLQEGDLLVTTGLDGVFPPDLKVAIVTSCSQRSGGYAYDLEAESLVPNLGELQTLFVLPPRSE